MVKTHPCPSLPVSHELLNTSEHVTSFLPLLPVAGDDHWLSDSILQGGREGGKEGGRAGGREGGREGGK